MQYPWPRRLLHRIGIDVVRYRSPRFPERVALELIDVHGVTMVFDVGASTGQTATALRTGGYHGRIVSFEPQTSAFADLADAARNDPSWDCLNVALGDESATTRVNVAENSWSSSVLPMTDRHRRAAPSSTYEGSEEARMVRLDDVRPEFVQPSDRLYLKLDVQGYEAEVIAGATETLRQTAVVEAEVSLVELYEGQTLMPEFVSLLRRHGFHPFHFAPEFKDAATGELLQLNGWFVRAEKDA